MSVRSSRHRHEKRARRDGRAGGADSQAIDRQRRRRSATRSSPRLPAPPGDTRFCTLSSTERPAYEGISAAAHLVDRVLPRAPYRQWVFTFPIPVRLALSRRPHLLAAALQACLRVLFAWQRRRMRRRGLRQPACGAVTFVQRLGSALQLNVHFHVLVPDGAFDDDGVFVAADPHDDEDVRTLLGRAGRRVIAVLRRFFDEHGADDETRRREVDCLLQVLDATSATPAPALFPKQQRRASLSAFVEGFSLHAATRVLPSDRRGLWRLCAYGARGALGASRLSELPDGRFAWDMKRALPDGRARLVLPGVELLEKLVPLIPPVYANLTRFHGVFAPTSRLRAQLVPLLPFEGPPTQCPPPGPAPSTPSVTTPAPAPSPKPSPPRSAYRLDGPALLKRVFTVDVMGCSRREGPLKVIAFLEEPTVVKGILTHLGLRAEPLPARNAQAPPTTVEMFEDPRSRGPGEPTVLARRCPDIRRADPCLTPPGARWCSLARAFRGRQAPSVWRRRRRKCPCSFYSRRKCPCSSYSPDQSVSEAPSAVGLEAAAPKVPLFFLFARARAKNSTATATACSTATSAPSAPAYATPTATSTAPRPRRRHLRRAGVARQRRRRCRRRH
jgi:hypothetical protein